MHVKRKSHVKSISFLSISAIFFVLPWKFKLFNLVVLQTWSFWRSWLRVSTESSSCVVVDVRSSPSTLNGQAHPLSEVFLMPCCSIHRLNILAFPDCAMSNRATAHIRLLCTTSDRPLYYTSLTITIAQHSSLYPYLYFLLS